MSTTDEIMKLADAYATQMIHAHYHPTREARAALLKAVEELARDAARYRWLREWLYKDEGDICFAASGAYDTYSGGLSEAFDAAIVAAMKETP